MIVEGTEPTWFSVELIFGVESERVAKSSADVADVEIRFLDLQCLDHVRNE